MRRVSPAAVHPGDIIPGQLPGVAGSVLPAAGRGRALAVRRHCGRCAPRHHASAGAEAAAMGW